MLQQVDTIEEAPLDRPAGVRRGGRVSRKPDLLQATIRCVARHGIGATTAQIAQEAGIPKSTIHYYFRDKTALIAAAFAEVLDGYTESLGRSITPTDPPAKQLETLILRLLPLERGGVERAVFWYEFILASLREPSLMPLQSAFAARARREVETRIRQITGDNAPLPPDELTMLVDACIEGLTMAIVRGEPLDRERHQRVVSFLVRRILGDEPPR